MVENLSTSNSNSETDLKTDFKSNFIRNLWGIIKIIIFIALIIPMVDFIGKKYSVASTENLINGYNQSRFNEFYELEPNSLDMVFIGSSHSYCTFDPQIFYDELGINAYQMGTPLQHIDSTYYTLREILNYQSPKKVVMEVYWDMIDDDFELKQATMLFQVMKNKELEQDYIKNVFPNGEKVKYNTSIFKYQADYFAFKNKEWKEKIEKHYNVSMPATEKQVGTEVYRSLGYTYCNYNMIASEYDKTNQFRKFDGKNWTPSEKQVGYLNKIIELCKEKNIELIFVTAPVALVSMDYIKNYDVVHNWVQNIADKNGIPYFDYNIINKDENLLTNENFRDDAHLNHSGVEIIDKNFIQKLKENKIF